MIPKKLRYDFANFEEFWASFKNKVEGHTKEACEKVMSRIRLGWKPEDKPFKLFNMISCQVRAQIPKAQPKRVVHGGALMVPVYLTGRPDCFMRNVPNSELPEGKRGKTHIKLCCNVDACAGVGQDLFYLRGAAMVALAEALEAAGKKVELSVAIATHPYSEPWGSKSDGEPYWTVEGALKKNQRYFVKVKPFTSPVSPLLHSYALMNPNVLRTLFFKFWDVLPADENAYWYQHTAGGVGVVPDHGADLYICEFGAHNAGDYNDGNGAKDWILNQMKAFGVNVITN